VGARVDQVPIHPHMIVKALEARAAGAAARYGPRRFPAVDFGEELVVRTPAEGGDGRALNDFRDRARSGIRSASGTMMTREEALKQKRLKALTTE
jgi:hypothetical protein